MPAARKPGGDGSWPSVESPQPKLPLGPQDGCSARMFNGSCYFQAHVLREVITGAGLAGEAPAHRLAVVAAAEHLGEEALLRRPSASASALR